MILKDKVAIVTGGGLNIGLEITRAFAREGAKVVIADICEEESQAALKEITAAHGDGHMFIKTDMMSEETIKHLVDTTMKAYGHIDCLINNAGIAGAQGEVETISLEDWRTCMSINLDGIFLACKYVAPIMKSQKSGSIVNIASVTGKNPLYARVPYCASKMAVIGLTRCLALELGMHGVRINSVCPGPVDGPRVKNISRIEAENTGRPFEEIYERFKNSTPLKTLIAPTAIADACVYLCGSHGGAYMTGEDMNVCAGSVMF